jgi:hypothetical protein
MSLAKSIIKGTSEWELANPFMKWTFSVVNPLIKLGETKQLNLEDLLELPQHDNSNRIVTNLERDYVNSSSFLGFPRLMVAMWKSNILEFSLCALLTLTEGLLRIACTILLGYYLDDLQDPNSPWRNSFILAAIISVINLLQSIVHHIVFKISMLMGNNVKIATIGMVFDHLFQIKGMALESSTVTSGQLVNLISNDVQRYEECAVVRIILYFNVFMS